MHISSEWIMVIITAIYVVATILICVFNARSANAAQKQLEMSNRQQEQNMKLQLFDRRMAIIKIFDGHMKKLSSNQWAVNFPPEFREMKFELDMIFDKGLSEFYVYVCDSTKNLNDLNTDCEMAEYLDKYRGKTESEIRMEKEKCYEELRRKYEIERARVIKKYLDFSDQ